MDATLQQPVEKAEILLEALPYIQRFSGKTVVIKYGGSVLGDASLQHTIFRDIALMKLVGIKPLLLHGGGPEINRALDQLKIQPSFVNGLRVTDAATMDVVEMVLSGKVNKNIVSQLKQQGVNAVGVSGKDGGLITVKKSMPKNQDIGFVGEVTRVNPALLHTLMQQDFVPVISSVASDENGVTYNVNADQAAVAIASELKAAKLIYLTDVPGILKDASDPTSAFSRLTLDEIPSLIDEKVISGGMIPKVTSCAEGIRQGIQQVHILDGRLPHSLLLEIFTTQGIGTLIEA